MNNNLSEEEYNALVRDAMRWRSKSNDATLKALAEFCEAFENRGETTSLREWNNQLKAAYENAREILVGRLPYADPKSQ